MSYITAFPFMLYGSSRRFPAETIVPSPSVVIQCISALGPAWNTRPSLTANSHAWLSPRYTCWSGLLRSSGSGPVIGLAEMPTNRLQPWPGAHSSPILSASGAPAHPPPIVNTNPLESRTDALYPRGTFISSRGFEDQVLDSGS